MLVENNQKENCKFEFIATKKLLIASLHMHHLEKYFLLPHIYSISWPLTTGNDPT